MPILADVFRLVRAYRLRRRAQVGRDVIVCGRLWIHGEGRLEIGQPLGRVGRRPWDSRALRFRWRRGTHGTAVFNDPALTSSW